MNLADPRLLAEYGLLALADKGYEGLDHDLGGNAVQKAGTSPRGRRSATGSAGSGKRMFAQLKKWSIFDQLRRDPPWATQPAKAVQVLDNYERPST